MDSTAKLNCWFRPICSLSLKRQFILPIALVKIYGFLIVFFLILSHPILKLTAIYLGSTLKTHAVSINFSLPFIVFQARHLSAERLERTSECLPRSRSCPVTLCSLRSGCQGALWLAALIINKGIFQLEKIHLVIPMEIINPENKHEMLLN